MQQPPNVPHGLGFEVWHGFLASTILATVTAIKLWLNRKKPDAEVHETEARTGKTWAETRKIDAEASKSFGEVILAMSDKLSEAQREIENQRERHASQVTFLQSQIEHKDESEQVARIRSHKAIAEVQRCVMTIRDYEEKMRQDDVTFHPFDFKSYEDIMETE